MGNLKKNFEAYIKSIPTSKSEVMHSIKYNLQFFTLSAGGALATALMFVELNQTCDGSDHISLEEKYNSHIIFPD